MKKGKTKPAKAPASKAREAFVKISQFADFTRAVHQDLHTIKAAFLPIVASHSPLERFPLNMRIDQVATYLRCSSQHVRNLIEEGKLEAINIAPGARKHLRISRDSVAAFKEKAKST